MNRTNLILGPALQASTGQALETSTGIMTGAGSGRRGKYRARM